MLAIMGSSGSGKTTLLNVLNLRNVSRLKVKSDVKVNGRKITDTQSLSKVCGYVTQHDLFFYMLTVKEHLTFQVKRKNLTNDKKIF